MSKRDDKLFSEKNSDIWGWTHCAPAGVGFLLMAFGNQPAQGFGFLLVAGVIGSFLTISFVEWIN